MSCLTFDEDSKVLESGLSIAYLLFLAYLLAYGNHLRINH